MNAASYFDDQANWRGQVAGEYPEDQRNPIAEKYLRGFASYLRQLPEDDERVAAISMEHGEYGLRGADEVHHLVRSAGFYFQIDYDSLLDQLVECVHKDEQEMLSS